MSRESFVNMYIETALWSSIDEEGNPLDKDHSIADIEPDTLQEMKEDAGLFYTYYKDLIEEGHLDDPDRRAGFLFWLNRNGHGSGFWDEEGFPEQIQQILSDASKSFGEYNLSVSERGTIFSLQEGQRRRPEKIFYAYPKAGPLDWFPPDEGPSRRKRKRPGMGVGLPEPKFKSDRIVMTPGAEDADSKLWEEHDQDVLQYVERHFSGDWGEIGPEDKAHNDSMIAQKGMILSAYTLPTGTKIWIITDPGHKTTTILLPEEY